MNKNPIYVSKSMSFENIQRLMKVNSVLQIPEIDNSGKLVKSIIGIQKLDTDQKKIFFLFWLEEKVKDYGLLQNIYQNPC